MTLIKMSKLVYIGCASMLAGCMLVNARSFHTGHLFVSLTDRETGGPITNATVTVRTQTEFNPGRTLESYFTKTSAQTDSNGIAHVEFQFCKSRFNWWVRAPSHYNGRLGPGHGDERFGCIVVKSDYLNINTNTVEGLDKYNEIRALYDSGDYLGFADKFKPKSVTYTNTVIHRSVCLTPKHNPRPMFAYDPDSGIYLPRKVSSVVTNNGIETVQYEPVDFDMKECLVVCSEPDYDYFVHGPTGKTSDFRIERFSVTTNGATAVYGSINFAPGCGAYIAQLPGDGHYPLIYEADTNETFLSNIPFEYTTVSGRVVQSSQLLSEDQCMVLKTRAVTNEVGEVVNCNYSKIYGPMTIVREMFFDTMVFNPTPNDPNLESATRRNLAYPRRRCRP